jgi:hypothetical protein
MKLPFVSRQRLQDAENRIVELERALFQSQQFEEIACGKLKDWVQKHDTLLVAHKKLLAQHNVLQNII